MKKIKSLIVFDLDPTLANGDLVMDTQIAGLLNQLLEITKVAVISGSDWSHFEKKLLPALPEKQYLKNLTLLPVSGYPVLSIPCRLEGSAYRDLNCCRKR